MELVHIHIQITDLTLVKNQYNVVENGNGRSL